MHLGAPQPLRRMIHTARRGHARGGSHVLNSPQVGRTLRISCEAVPPSIRPAGAQGGTSARSTGAALSFVSCIRLLGGPNA